jgi:hypothetical protein
MTIEVTITIWLPVGVSAVVVEHEETHRQIIEKIYADADKVATRAAKSCAGRTFTGKGATAAAAEKHAIEQAQKTLMDDYVKNAPAVWARVNEIFDELTMHGVKSIPGVKGYIDAKTGMEKAFEQYEEEVANAAGSTPQNVTQPALPPAVSTPPAPPTTPPAKKR